MVIKLKQITGEEFIKKVLDGEKDFSRIKLLESGANLNACVGFRELVTYLPLGGYKDNPLNISYSDFRGITAPRLWLPGVHGTGVDFRGANLQNSNFMDAFLLEANFRGANLIDAYFSCTYLNRAQFGGADVRQASFSDAFVGSRNLLVSLHECGADIGTTNMLKIIDYIT